MNRMEKQKYRCIVRTLLGEAKEMTTFFFATSTPIAQGKVCIFLEMWLGLAIKSDYIKVSSEPSLIPGKQSNIVTASIEVSEQRVPALTAYFILESEYQALLHQDAQVDALKGLDAENTV